MQESLGRVAIIGAGPSGIAAGKNCITTGLECTIFDQNSAVGGNWLFSEEESHSSVYENTHIISSKTWSEYEDFPMPGDYPDYPSHRELQRYFSNYAEHFGVTPHIRFRHRVDHVTRRDDGRWRIDFTDDTGEAQAKTFDHLMVANGHHWAPKMPQYPGTFNGRLMHSHQFKRIDDSYRGQRVLIVGAGNSACDVAVETARVSANTCLSVRSGQWFFPKFICGIPGDLLVAKMRPLPGRLQQKLFKWTLLLLQGPNSNYGLPTPTSDPLAQHPTLNSDLLDFIRHGRIHPRPAVESLDGDDVVFADGSRESFDIIVAATGYRTVFPFFDASFIDYEHSTRIPLFRRMMHEAYDNLYFIGLFQPVGCIWPMADHQARLACEHIRGRYERPNDIASRIQHEVNHPHFRFDGGSRHAMEVDYHRFRKELGAELATAGVDIGKAPPDRKGFRYRSPLRRPPKHKPGWAAKT